METRNEPGTVAPVFSIVVPAYNRADSIEPTLRSVLAQEFQDWECVVVDDGSDDAPALASRIQRLADPRFRLVRRTNGGGGAARNSGIEAARGSYIAFLDSDDTFLPDKLDTFAGVVEQREDRAWYSRTIVDRGRGRRWIKPSRSIRPDEDMGAYLFVDNEVIQTSTIVLARSLALRVMFDPSLRKGQDLDFCLRLHAAGVRFEMIDRPLSIWLDQTETGRTSRVRGYEAPLEWLARSRPLLSRSAELGYRANVLAYFMAHDRPFTSMADIVRGWLIGGVRWQLALRQVLRCYLPRSWYRQAVDMFISARRSSVADESARGE